MNTKIQNNNRVRFAQVFTINTNVLPIYFCTTTCGNPREMRSRQNWVGIGIGIGIGTGIGIGMEEGINQAKLRKVGDSGEIEIIRTLPNGPVRL